MAWVNYKINSWLLITQENCLFKAGVSYVLEPRITKLLAFLAQHQGIVYNRDELIENVWDGAIVSDQVVTQSIFELRKILKKMGEECWIITIPKRGYKLDVDVQQIYVDPNTGFKLEEFHSSHEYSPEEEVLSPFPAAPMTRALTSNTIKETNPIVNNKGSTNTTKWTHWVFDITMIALLAITIISISYTSNNQQTIRPNLNPTLINIDYPKAFSSPIIRSIAQIIQTELYRNTFYISHLEHYNNAGKTLYLYITKNGDLSIKLYNNIEKNILLQKSYSLDKNLLSKSINSAVSDFIEELNYKNTLLHKTAIISDNQQLESYLQLPSLWTKENKPQILYLKRLNKLINKYPNNAYLLAQRYLSYAIILTLDSKDTYMPKLMKYGRELEKQTNNQSQFISSEVYDALALNMLYQGNVEQAQYYLVMAQSQSVQNTALRYILLGKVAELSNKHSLAQEYYNMAQYLDPSPTNKNLVKNLVYLSK
ncbi:winged helix-turn-helix domain-containing protein [Photobacterium damselae]|uniref:winged helix-turn-helix domain-containing protein n=1 Tax=Photobacterium damselae TaxID=38293 RepID=UPI003D7D2129